MTDESKDLCARLLTRFCGWRWMREKKRGKCVLFPPFPASGEVGIWMGCPQANDVEQETKFYDTIAAAPPDDERFRDWHRASMRERHDGHYENGMPCLTESLDACEMLKAAILARGMRLKTDSFLSPSHTSIRGEVWIRAKIMDNADDCIAVWSGEIPAYSASAEAMAVCLAADAIPAEANS